MDNIAMKVLNNRKLDHYKGRAIQLGWNVYVDNTILYFMFSPHHPTKVK